MSDEYPATCCFLDNGLQRFGHSGSSNVILLPPPVGQCRPHAIVIDCGDQYSATRRLLRKANVSFIEQFVITHNDDDHCAGVVKLLEEYFGRVGEVWALQARVPEDLEFLGCLRAKRREGAFQFLCHLQVERPGLARVLYGPLRPPAGGAPQVSLELLYPWFEESIADQLAGDRNRGSAILRLSCDDGPAILFTGDGHIATLQNARDQFVLTRKLPPETPLACDVLAVPHHGGMLARRRPKESQLRDLYAHTIRYRYAVVSVATRNTDGHPFEEHIQALAYPDPAVPKPRHVLCTQITQQCCSQARLDFGGHVLPPALDVPQASDGLGRDGTACAGTVVVHVGRRPLVPERADEHWEAVDGLCKPGSLPLCRRCPSSAPAAPVGTGPS